jgi:hypothetical protein
MLKGCKPSRTPEIDTDSTTPHSASKESSSYPSNQTLRRTRTILNFWAFLLAGSGVLFSDAIFKQIFGFEFSRAPALRTSPTKDSSVRADQYSTCKICQTVCFQQPCYALPQRMWGPVNNCEDGSIHSALPLFGGDYIWNHYHLMLRRGKFI